MWGCGKIMVRRHHRTFSSSDAYAAPWPDVNPFCFDSTSLLVFLAWVLFELLWLTILFHFCNLNHDMVLYCRSVPSCDICPNAHSNRQLVRTLRIASFLLHTPTTYFWKGKSYNCSILDGSLFQLVPEAQLNEKSQLAGTCTFTVNDDLIISATRMAIRAETSFTNEVQRAHFQILLNTNFSLDWLHETKGPLKYSYHTNNKSLQQSMLVRYHRLMPLTAIEVKLRT